MLATRRLRCTGTTWQTGETTRILTVTSRSVCSTCATEMEREGGRGAGIRKGGREGPLATSSVTSREPVVFWRQFMLTRLQPLHVDALECWNGPALQTVSSQAPPRSVRNSNQPYAYIYTPKYINISFLGIWHHQCQFSGSAMVCHETALHYCSTIVN